MISDLDTFCFLIWKDIRSKKGGI